MNSNDNNHDGGLPGAHSPVRSKFLLGVSEGYKKGFVKGISQTRASIGKELARTTDLSDVQISEILGCEFSKAQALAK